MPLDNVQTQTGRDLEDAVEALKSQLSKMDQDKKELEREIVRLEKDNIDTKQRIKQLHDDLFPGKEEQSLAAIKIIKK